MSVEIGIHRCHRYAIFTRRHFQYIDENFVRPLSHSCKYQERLGIGTPTLVGDEKLSMIEVKN